MSQNTFFDGYNVTVPFEDMSHLHILLEIAHNTAVQTAKFANEKRELTIYYGNKEMYELTTELLKLSMFDMFPSRDDELKKKLPEWENRPFFTDEEFSDKPVFIDDFDEVADVPF